MDTYEVELASAEPDGFAVTIPSFPGLLILGATIDEVLARARASIAFHVRVPDDELLADEIALVRSTYPGLHRSVASSSQPLGGLESGDSAA